jgi:hypothetical protein
MEGLKLLKEKLSHERPVEWNEFPDIGLYKDQVVSYMQRQVINFDENHQITSAMINNYIKDNLLPRTDGKKYSKEHLAGLTEICILKQVLSVKDTGLLMKQELLSSSPKEFYTKFKEILESELTKTAETINTDWEMESLSDMALRLAVSSYCNKLASERLLEIIRASEEKKLEKKNEKKPDKNNEKKPEKKPEK